MIVTPTTASLTSTGFSPSIGLLWFPSVHSVTETSFGGDSTTHNVNMPATVSLGDLLLCLFGSDGTPTHTTPTDWTSKGSAVSDSGKMTVFIKIADGTEGGTTVNFATSASERAAAKVYQIKNWFTSLAGVDAAFISSVVGEGDPPSLTPSWGAQDTLWIAVTFVSGSYSFVGGPTNYTNADEFQSGLGDGSFGIQCADARRKLNVATEDPGPFDWANEESHGAITIAVRPRGPVIPATAALVLTIFTPRVINPKSATPTTLALVIATFAPSLAVVKLTKFGVIQRSLNSADYGDVILEVHGKTSDAGKLFWARLYNVTLGQYTGNGLSSNTTITARLRSDAFALDAGTNIYEVHFGGETGATHTCYDATLIVEVT